MRTKKIDRFQGILLLIILLYSIFVAVKNPPFAFPLGGRWCVAPDEG